MKIDKDTVLSVLLDHGKHQEAGRAEQELPGQGRCGPRLRPAQPVRDRRRPLVQRFTGGIDLPACERIVAPR